MNIQNNEENNLIDDYKSPDVQCSNIESYSKLEIFKRLQHIIDYNGYKKFELYYHQDLDGVVSAIDIRNILEKKFNLKYVKSIYINRGPLEYCIPKPNPEYLSVLLDYSSYKEGINLHIDHHYLTSIYEEDINEDNVLFIFDKDQPSNLQVIDKFFESTFSREDINIVNIIDSADFKDVKSEWIKYSLVIDEDKDSEYIKRLKLGLVLTELINIHKLDDEILNILVENSDSSLDSIYTLILFLRDNMSEYKYITPLDDLDKNLKKYKYKYENELNNPDSFNKLVKIEKNVITQLSFGVHERTGKGGYNRYVPYMVCASSIFKCHYWEELQLLSFSINPFLKYLYPDIDLISSVYNPLKEEFKEQLEDINISLLDIKKDMEVYTYKTDNPINFNYRDFKSLFCKYINKIKQSFKRGEELEFEQYLENNYKYIIDKNYKDLNTKEKNLLKKINIDAYDLITQISGGHKVVMNWDLKYIDKVENYKLIQEMFEFVINKLNNIPLNI